MNDSSTKSRKNSHLQEWFTSKVPNQKIFTTCFVTLKLPGAHEFSRNAER